MSKRSIFKVLVFFLVLILVQSGCGRKGNDDFHNDRYFLLKGDNGAIVSIDTKSKTSKFVCPDPACSHNKEQCLYVAVSDIGLYQINRYTFYMRDSKLAKQNELGLYSLWQYDMKTNEVKELFDQGTYLSSLATVDHYLYFGSKRTEVKNPDSSDPQVVSVVDEYQYDMNNGKITCLKENVAESFLTLQSYYSADRLYWSMDSKSFSTDYQFQDKRNLTAEEKKYQNACGGDWKYLLSSGEMLYGGGFEAFYNVKRTEIATGETVDFITDGESGELILNDYFFYVKPLSEPIYLGEQWNTKLKQNLPRYQYSDYRIGIKRISTMEETEIVYDPKKLGGVIQIAGNGEANFVMLDDRYVVFCPQYTDNVEILNSEEKCGNVLLVDIHDGKVDYISFPEKG